MNNEFKKSRQGMFTRYILESASAGGTSSGSIASTEMPVGGMQRRQGDNLIAQEGNKDKVDASKPRNFVAKNAKMGGAGQHKDKKKAEKQGDVKHKKPFMEGEVVGFPKKHRGDLEGYDECPKCGGDLQGGKYMGRAVKVCQPCKQVFLPPNSGIDQHGNEMSEDHEIQMASSELQSIAKNAGALLQMVQKYSEQEGLEAWQQSKITKAADYLNAVLQSISGEQSVAEAERTMSRAAKGNEKYGKDGMKALAKAGREGASEKKLDAIRDKHDHYNEGVAEGLPQTLRKVVPGYAKREIDKKMDAGKFGKTDADKDANFQRYKKIQDKIKDQGVAEEWSKKYKSSINCSHPKGFSQKAHCAGKKKHDESIEMEMTCPDCGMCQTHGNVMEIKKGAKDSNGFTKCWPGHHAAGTKKGKNGGQVRNCVPNNEGVDYMMELAAKLAEKIPKNAPVDVWIKDFEKSNAPQFRGKNKAKRKQMAIAASYGAKNPSKKK